MNEPHGSNFHNTICGRSSSWPNVKSELNLNVLSTYIFESTRHKPLMNLMIMKLEAVSALQVTPAVYLKKKVGQEEHT